MAKPTVQSTSIRSRIFPWWWSYRIARKRRLTQSASTERFRLTREGLHLSMVVIFIFVGAVLRDINLLILIAAAMIGLLLLQWRFNVGIIRGLSATRKLPERATEGNVVDCVVSVRNPRAWLGAWLVLVEDSISQTAPVVGREVARGVGLIDEIPTKAVSSARYELLFKSRGKYQVGPCTVSTRFPLNLGRGWRKLDVIDEITIHPRLGTLTAAGRNFLKSDREGQATSSRHAGVHETEFFGLRPWATGDSRRWIHWRTTARLGELSVRQFERQQQQQACLLLDLFREARDQNSADHEACERAISFVATVTLNTVRRVGNKIAVAVAANRSLALTNIQSPVLVNNLMDELATISPSSEPDHFNALSRMSVTLLQNPNLLIVSTRSEQLASLRSVLRRMVGSRTAARLDLQWLNVTQGDLEPFFTWNPVE